MSLKDKRIVVGVSGGIAAYKAVELVRLLISGGAKVRVCMTKNGTKFVTPLTFEAITGEKVIWDMFSQEGPEISHISWAKYAELIAIAPATANIISKLAHGIADDFLTTMILAAGCPILICPSMNSKMYQNPVILQNIQLLRNRGIRVMEPSEGELACGEIGPGRLPDPEDIVYEIRYLLSSKDLEGRRIVVTAGPTWEAMDPVRFITNRSSGKMGYALAREAYLRGAEVVLISGPSNERPPRGIEFINVSSAREMKDAVLDKAKRADAIIKAAAVSDYRPKYRAKSKIKKGVESLTLELVKNPDILSELGKKRSKRRCVLVGFAAETEDVIQNAKKKLKEKNLDFIVANDVSRKDSGFQTDTNLVKIIHRDGRVQELPLLKKEMVANIILDHVVSLLDQKR